MTTERQKNKKVFFKLSLLTLAGQNNNHSRYMLCHSFVHKQDKAHNYNKRESGHFESW